MKKVIIFGFFMLMIVSTYALVYVTTYIKMNDSEVSFEVRQQPLSDTDVDYVNTHNMFEKALNPREENIRVDEVKITRTKKGFSWETKIDTLKTYVFQR